MDFFEGLGSLIDKAAPVVTARYQAKANANALYQPQLGAEGYYTDGQPGRASAGGGIVLPTSMLLLGGVVLVAVLMLKD